MSVSYTSEIETSKSNKALKPRNIKSHKFTLGPDYLANIYYTLSMHVTMEYKDSTNSLILSNIHTRSPLPISQLTSHVCLPFRTSCLNFVLRCQNYYYYVKQRVKLKSKHLQRTPRKCITLIINYLIWLQNYDLWQAKTYKNGYTHSDSWRVRNVLFLTMSKSSFCLLLAHE